MLDDNSYTDSKLIITCHSIAAVIVLVVSVRLQMYVRPYAYSIQNKLETWLLIASVVILILGYACFPMNAYLCMLSYACIHIPHSQPTHCTLRDPTLHTTPLYTTLHHFTPLYTTPLYTTPLHTTPLYTTLDHFTPHHFTPHHFTPHHFTPL